MHTLTDLSYDTQASASSLRSIQKCLWDLLSEHLREAERDEVKRAIGTLLVDENKALFDEATALADILGDVQLKTSALLQRRQLCSNPERNMIESDIMLVMDRLRAVVSTAVFTGSAARDRQLDDVVPKANAQDKAVYEYIQTSTAQGPASVRVRPSTASSRPPTASTLSRPSTASSSTANSTTDPSLLLADMQGKLSVFSIDEVKETLQCALHEERACLLNDIEYLTALLTDETDMQHHAAATPPSLSELKQYSCKLKSLLVSEEGRLQHEVTVSRMFNAAETEGSKAGRLRRMVSASREPLPPPRRIASPAGHSDLRPSSSPLVSNSPSLAHRPPSLPGLAPSDQDLLKRASLRCADSAADLWHPGAAGGGTLKRTTSSQSTHRGHTAMDPSPSTKLSNSSQSHGHESPAQGSPQGALRQPTCHDRQPGSERAAEKRVGTRGASEQLNGQLQPQGQCQEKQPWPRGGQLQGLHSGPARKSLGTDLMAAEAETLKGGVAAILARHKYSPPQ